MNLWINYYREKNPIRAAELQEALNKNLECSMIQKIYLLTDVNVPDEQCFSSGKIKIIKRNWTNWNSSFRPRYSDFFAEINYRTKAHEINIIANSDISFDESLVHLMPCLPEHVKTCAILSRLDEGKHTNPGADAWAFKGKIDPAVWGDFFLGVPACDWRIYQELLKQSYTIFNPSKKVNAHHHHASSIRNWTNADYVAGTPFDPVSGHLQPQDFEAIINKVKQLTTI